MSEMARRLATGSTRVLGARARSLLGVGVGIALLLVVNTVVRETGVGAAGAPFVGSPSLPVVQMARPSAWRCPGPLPVGVGKESSRIALVNSATSPVGVVVTVSRTGLPVDGISSRESVSTSRLEVGADSQTVLTLPRRGPAGFAAVSIETDGGGIGVAESIRGGSNLAGGVLLSSPCTLGSAPSGYLPTGSTLGSSDVEVSLYDPDATPAVVDVSVSNGSTLTAPPAFQGLVVPATGLVVLDLRRWVFQVSSLAVTASGVSGDLVVGALETTSATVVMASGSTGAQRVTRVQLTGSSLLVGSDRGLGQWAFTALQSRLGVASMYSVYDPGARSVSVSVAPPGRSGRVAALTEDVPAGGMVDFATPIAPGARVGVKSVVVSAEGGTAIVVARLTTRQRGRVLEELNATSGTAGPQKAWLLPGAMVTPSIDDVVTLDDPGVRNASVTLLALTDGPAPAVHLGVVKVFAGSERNVDLKPLLKHAPAFALEVRATVPILAEQQLRPDRGQTTAIGGIPVSP
ncbi:MAG: hypothetical protein ABR972_05445 [Acidimicrobiales bacterium]|jgi:hypothetical protein